MYDCRSGNKQLSAENEIGTFEEVRKVSSNFKLQKEGLPQWAVDWARNKFNMDAKGVKFYVMNKPKSDDFVALAGGNNIFVSSSHKDDKEVIKHELTHIYQQSIGSAQKSNANDPRLEIEAIEVSHGKNLNISKNIKLDQGLVTPKENTGLVQGFDGSEAKIDNEDEVVVIRPSQGEVLTINDTNQYRNCERIRIDDSVTSIDKEAFSNFENLVSIDMPKVTTIGERAFYNCKNLIKVDIPNVTDIGINAFGECKSLDSIDMPNVIRIDKYTFTQCESLIKVDIPNVSMIDTGVFFGCKSLSNIGMPKVTNIDENAFGGCEGLVKVDLPNVTKINNHVFQDCKNLKEINMPNIKEMGDGIFEGCTGLTKIDISNIAIIGYGLFTLCEKLKEINMPNVKEIGVAAFFGCKSLTKINLPSVKRIAEYAFKDCKGLINVGIPDATIIAEHAFDGCESLEEVNMPNVNEIDDAAFYNCMNLKNIDLTNVRKIGEGAFYYCCCLEDIDMPNVATIGKNAFYSCKKLSGVGMEKVMFIGESAFIDCMTLQSVDMPIVINIDADAFKNCENLRKVILPYYCNCVNSGFPYSCEIKYEHMPDLSKINKLQLIKMYELKEIKQGCFLKNINIDNINFADEGNYYLLLDALYSKSVRLAYVISKFKIKPEDLLTSEKYGFDIYDAYMRDWISEDEIRELMPNINMFSSLNKESDASRYLDGGIELKDEFKENLPNFEKLSKVPENIISEFTSNYRGNSALWNGMRSGIYKYSEDTKENSKVLINLMQYMRNTGNDDMKLYRGIRDYETMDYMANASIGSFAKNDQYILGKEIFDRSFTSTTITEGTARSYAEIESGNKRAVILEITVPRGRKLNMVPIANENDEVVFNRFQKLKVKQIKEENGVKIITCEAIEDKDNLCETEKDIYESSEFRKYQEEFEIDLGRYLYRSNEAYQAVQKGINMLRERNSEKDLRKVFYSNEKYTAENFSGNVTEFGGQDLTDEKLEALLKNQKPTDEELQSSSTTVAGNLREKLGAFQFAVDDGVIDDVDSSSQESGKSGPGGRKRPGAFEPHIGRKGRTDDDQEKLRRDFDYQDKELQLFRSARERGYQEKFQKNGKSPITYGGMLFQPQYNEKDIDSFYGKRLVAGTSGTTMRLLSKYREQVSSDEKDLLNFRLVLMACMLPEKNHSLYEILQGSHEVGVKGYENLSTADTMDKTIDPLGEDKVRKNVCKDQKFPYERALEDCFMKNVR